MKEELLEPFLRWLRVRMISQWIPNNCVLADIGCGFEASFLRSIQTKIRKGYGIDRKVASLSNEGLELINSDLNLPLPIQNEIIDCVTLLAVLEHIEEPLNLFNEIQRIIKKGGMLIITTPTPKSKPLLEFLSFKLGIVSPLEIADHKHYWTKDEMKNLLNRTGFSIIQYKRFCFGFNSFLVAKRIQP